MSLGLMNKHARIAEFQKVQDSDGFTNKTLVVLQNIRVYVEGRHGSEHWANLSTFSDATELFRFRKIPNFQVKTEHYIIFDNNQYNILSVENVKGRNMYIEVLAKKVEPSNG